jgi:hypothetical protein
VRFKLCNSWCTGDWSHLERLHCREEQHFLDVYNRILLSGVQSRNRL